jgi:hypothetical protein
MMASISSIRGNLDKGGKTSPSISVSSVDRSDRVENGPRREFVVDRAQKLLLKRAVPRESSPVVPEVVKRRRAETAIRKLLSEDRRSWRRDELVDAVVECQSNLDPWAVKRALWRLAIKNEAMIDDALHVTLRRVP